MGRLAPVAAADSVPSSPEKAGRQDRSAGHSVSACSAEQDSPQAEAVPEIEAGAEAVPEAALEAVLEAETSSVPLPRDRLREAGVRSLRSLPVQARLDLYPKICASCPTLINVKTLPENI